MLGLVPADRFEQGDDAVAADEDNVSLQQLNDYLTDPLESPDLTVEPTVAGRAGGEGPRRS